MTVIAVIGMQKNRKKTELIYLDYFFIKLFLSFNKLINLIKLGYKSFFNLKDNNLNKIFKTIMLRNGLELHY